MLFLSGPTAPSSPIIAVNVFAQRGRDPRVPAWIGPLAAQLAAVGRIVTTRLVPLSENKEAPLTHASSTGFLVSPCYVLTTAHGVFGVPRPGPDPALKGLTEVTFITGQSTNPQTLSQTSGWVVAEGHPFRVFEQDWALVHLIKCEGRRLGWLQIANSDQQPFSPVSIAGFPGDKAKTILWYQASCHLMRFDPQNFIWETDCSTSPGSSGSPIFTMSGKSKLDVIAMTIMEERHTNIVLRNYSSEQANYALDLRYIQPYIQKYIEDDLQKR